MLLSYILLNCINLTNLHPTYEYTKFSEALHVSYKFS
jgi:hypothetical protein